MLKNKTKFTIYERNILIILIKKNRWLNTTEIANLGKMSWNTADKYLTKMYNFGWLSKNKSYWRVRIKE